MEAPFDSRQLLNFVTLARTRSFTETARELHLTQSAISHSIKGLEVEVGRKLFHRAGKRLLLTEAGECMRREATDILSRMTELRHKLENESAWGKGRLRLAANTSCCQFLLPEVLREFKQSFPDSSVTVMPANGPESLELLRNNEVDLALTLKPVEEARDVEFSPLFKDELRLIMAPFHPWVRRKSIPSEVFSSEPFLIFSKSSYTHLLLVTQLRRQGLHMANVLEMGNYEAIKEMVKIGQGIAVMAPWVAQKELNDDILAQRAIPSTNVERQWGFANLKNRKMSLLEETFVGLCAEGKERLLKRNVVVYG